MASESWLRKFKSAAAINLADLFHPKGNVSILAFEIAGLMSKLLHLWRSLSDDSLICLRNETITLPGVRKLVSDDDAFLIALACAELMDGVRSAAASTSDLCRRCADPALRQFFCLFKDFSDSGSDPFRWVMTWKEMQAKAKKMEGYVASAAALYKEMDELAEADRGLGRPSKAEFFLKRRRLKNLKHSSPWSSTFDCAVSLLVRSSFTILARIKHVFGIPPITQTNSTFISATVHPETPPPAATPASIIATSTAALVPPPTTVGAACLAPHYAKLIVQLERRIQAPSKLADGRDEMYGMMTARLRTMVRRRLRGLGRDLPRDVELAAEWTATIKEIMDWLGPVAHWTLRWHGERSFERWSAGAVIRINVLVFQTLYFANREKVEAAIVELLVGLNYIWRFEMEVRGKCMSL
ncbi:uncharacterized protein LOC110036934 isoform X2 [Phalaenopsis equestris]|uniref:uncharacterized protein LOC110036934 isoform X2 n=1 Tax=Phalaenopsis equestris TaxID=78828 RepID=UPI0009E45428|nr:uncharacterized protein LOC110036934 isoform X2 [Phalaenopsis equestris]